MRVKRELEPKSTKTAMPPALGQNSDSVTQHPVVTFIPVDIHMQSRQLWTRVLLWEKRAGVLIHTDLGLTAKQHCTGNSSSCYLVYRLALALPSLFERRTKWSEHFLYDQNQLVKAYRPWEMQWAFLQSSGYRKTKWAKPICWKKWWRLVVCGALAYSEFELFLFCNDWW